MRKGVSRNLLAAWVTGLVVLPLGSAAAQSPVATHEGLVVYEHEQYRCANSVGFSVEAEEPHLFFNVARLEKLVAATRIALQFDCPQATRANFRGQHDGHYLGYFDVDLPRGMLLFTDSYNDPLWKPLLPSGGRAAPGRRGGASPQMSARQKRLQGFKESIQTPVEDRRFFYQQLTTSHIRFGEVQSFANIGGSSYRYTTASRFLEGNRYFFYPYQSDDSSNTIWQKPAESATPMSGIEVGRSDITITTKEGTQTASYGVLDGRLDGAQPECFRTTLYPTAPDRLFRNDYCFTFVSGISIDRDYKEFFYLASVYRRQGASTQTPWALVVLGHLVPASAEEIGQEFGSR